MAQEFPWSWEQIEQEIRKGHEEEIRVGESSQDNPDWEDYIPFYQVNFIPSELESLVRILRGEDPEPSLDVIDALRAEITVGLQGGLHTIDEF